MKDEIKLEDKETQISGEANVESKETEASEKIEPMGERRICGTWKY